MIIAVVAEHRVVLANADQIVSGVVAVIGDVTALGLLAEIALAVVA